MAKLTTLYEIVMEEFTLVRRNGDGLKSRSDTVALLDRLFEVDDATRKRTNNRIEELKQLIQGPDGQKERQSIRPLLPSSTLDRLSWEDLQAVEAKLTAAFGPNLDDFFVRAGAAAILSAPAPSSSASSGIPSTPRGSERRRGINLSVNEETSAGTVHVFFFPFHDLEHWS